MSLAVTQCQQLEMPLEILILARKTTDILDVNLHIVGPEWRQFGRYFKMEGNNFRLG